MYIDLTAASTLTFFFFLFSCRLQRMLNFSQSSTQIVTSLHLGFSWDRTTSISTQILQILHPIKHGRGIHHIGIIPDGHTSSVLHIEQMTVRLSSNTQINKFKKLCQPEKEGFVRRGGFQTCVSDVAQNVTCVWFKCSITLCLSYWLHLSDATTLISELEKLLCRVKDVGEKFTVATFVLLKSVTFLLY